MRLAVLLPFFLLHFFHLEAQEIPFCKYKFREQIDRERESAQLRDVMAAYFYTYIGDYKKAMNIPGIEIPLRWGFDTLAEKEAQYLQTFRPVDAAAYLVEHAKDRQIVLISESHNKPQHRVFTRTLLKGFYENGFRYFGMEALQFNHFDTARADHLLDTGLVERGFPKNSMLTGTFTREPQMGNLVREAINQGYQLFAYDGSFNRNREVVQARYIKSILDRDPDAKILVHCGQYHLLEEPLNPGDRQIIVMGQLLKEMTGIDLIFWKLRIKRRRLFYFSRRGNTSWRSSMQKVLRY